MGAESSRLLNHDLAFVKSFRFLGQCNLEGLYRWRSESGKVGGSSYQWRHRAVSFSQVDSRSPSPMDGH